MLLHGGRPLIACTGADLLNAFQIHTADYCPITSLYRQGRGDRTSQAMIIKILFFSPKGSSECTRKDLCLLALLDGAVLSV